MSDTTLTITGGRLLELSPFVVAGIVNATPDSFSDGGLYRQPGAALALALRLWDEGAGILDVGGESTRPGSNFVDADTELARLAPVLRGLGGVRALRAKQPAAALDDICGEMCGEFYSDLVISTVPDGPLPPVSVDTWRAVTARAALEAGAEIINDISGGLFDPGMAAVLAEYRPGYILGHAPAPPRTMQNAPLYGDVLEELYTFFARRLEALAAAGLPPEHVVLDVGIGFGKSLEHNLQLLRGIGRLHSLGRPLCLGVSRKSLFGQLLGLPGGEARDAATQALTAIMAGRGVLIHRVHAVAGAVQALKLANAIMPA